MLIENSHFILVTDWIAAVNVNLEQTCFSNASAYRFSVSLCLRSELLAALLFKGKLRQLLAAVGRTIPKGKETSSLGYPDTTRVSTMKEAILMDNKK